MLLGDIGRTVEDISHLSLLRVEHATIDKELVLNLDPLVLKRGGGAIRKRLWVFELDRKRVGVSLQGRGASLGSCTGLV